MSNALQLIFLQGGILGCLLHVMFCTLLVSATVELAARSDTGALPFVPFMLFCQAGVLLDGAHTNCLTLFGGSAGCFSTGLYLYHLHSLLAVTGCFSLLAWCVAIVGRLMTKQSAEHQPAVATVCYGGTIAVLTGVILNLFVTVIVVGR